VALTLKKPAGQADTIEIFMQLDLPVPLNKIRATVRGSINTNATTVTVSVADLQLAA
jgi:hypothetical protein